MELINQVLSAIFQLPWSIKGPGLILMAMFILRSAYQLVTLRPVRSATNLVYCVIVALVLYNYGADLEVFFASPATQPSNP